MHRIEVCIKEQLPDSAGQGLVKEISSLGIKASPMYALSMFTG